MLVIGSIILYTS